MGTIQQDCPIEKRAKTEVSQAILGLFILEHGWHDTPGSPLEQRFIGVFTSIESAIDNGINPHCEEHHRHTIQKDDLTLIGEGRFRYEFKNNLRSFHCNDSYYISPAYVIDTLRQGY